MVCHLTRLIIIGLFWVLASTASSAELSDWSEYSSEHFLLYSDRPARQADRLLQDFERFRLAVLAVVGMDHLEEDQRTQIYLFNDPDTYKLMQPDQTIAGYYRDTLQGARMVVGAEFDLQDVGLVLFHEYAHHLMRSSGAIHYPLWYDEGFADLLASATISKRSVVLGQANPWREETLAGKANLPLKELLKAPEGKTDTYWDRFYATSWLFVHYLQLEYIQGDQERADQVRRFLVDLHSGMDPVVAFRAHFAMPLEQMDAVLASYAKRRVWKGYQISVGLYKGTLKRRRLAKNEAIFRLGDLAYRSGQPQAALNLLQYIDASQKSAASALSLRAVLEAHQSHLKVAQHFIDLALKMDPENPVVSTNAAHFYWDWLGAQVDTSARSDALSKVKRFANSALSGDEENLEAGRFLAHALSQSGERHKAIKVLQNIHRLRPTDLLLNFELGQFLANSEHPKAAAPYLKKVLAWDHSLARKRQAKRLLEKGRSGKSVVISQFDE